MSVRCYYFFAGWDLNNSPVMVEDEQQFEEKLPARITGLVFWSLVFIGLLIAVFILGNIEEEYKERNLISVRIISYEIENILEKQSSESGLKGAFPAIRARVAELKELYDFNAIALSEGKQQLLIGEANESDEAYQHTLHYYPKGSSDLQEVEIQLYCSNTSLTIAELRKNILLSIGLGVFVFGLFLQRVLHKLISAPFNKMVETARQFSLGNEDVRFDDKRQDEFGYLGGFINNAISAVLTNNSELTTALQRVSLSEQELSVQKEHAEVTLHSITDSVITVDNKECILYINPAAENLLDVSADRISGKPFSQTFRIIDENTSEEISDPLHQCFLSKEIVHLPEHSSLVKSDGTLISIEASLAPMKSFNGEMIGAVMVVQDVSHTRRLTRQLSYQASHDLLTGLYNRRKFEEHLADILEQLATEEHFHSLLYLDLDNFKIVNDTCGHVAGDELLKQLPSLFNNVLRSGDAVARLGGDEFGIILENCKIKQARTIADKIRQTIKDYRFVWDDRTFEIGVSIGVVGIDADNADMAQVLSCADIACYAAKDSGRNRVHIFEKSDQFVHERFGQMHWTAKISDALENHRFCLFQQPIVRLSGGVCNHHEILIRMLGENDEIIPPGAFLPAAERYGLMRDIDRWVIAEVFRYMGQDNPDDPITGTDRILTVNLSGDSINDDTLLDYILQEKETNQISLSNVCFEVTETVAISNLSKATAFINELKQHGCKFALDDFGSGLSSFTYLKTLPVNYLKIDGSFVRDISRDSIDRAMVESIQQVGNAMSLETIAEHVEDEATLQVLREVGVDFVQGYHTGRPFAINMQPDAALKIYN